MDRQCNIAGGPGVVVVVIIGGIVGVVVVGWSRHRSCSSRDK